MHLYALMPIATHVFSLLSNNLQSSSYHCYSHSSSLLSTSTLLLLHITLSYANSIHELECSLMPVPLHQVSCQTCRDSVRMHVTPHSNCDHALGSYIGLDVCHFDCLHVIMRFFWSRIKNNIGPHKHIRICAVSKHCKPNTMTNARMHHLIQFRWG